MNKTKKNLIFIFLVILLLSTIICFNYYRDCYGIFHKRKTMSVYVNEPNLINIYLKAYKNIKSDTLIIGSSDAKMLFTMSYILKNKSNSIYGVKNYGEYYKILKRYLELHPETKNVVLIINYMLLLENPNIAADMQYYGNNLNIKDLSYLLISYDITKQNLHYNTNMYYNDKFTYYFFKMHPYGIDLDIVDTNILKNRNKNFYYINLIFELLKSKNIDYTVVIPPYHAYYLSVIYKNKNLQRIITDLKRLCVNNAKYIYDMAFINKYTSQSFFEGRSGKEKYNYYYSTPVHPGIIFGSKLYRILFDNQKADDKGIYLKVTKENFDKQTEYEEKLLHKYFNDNKEKINKYFDNAKGKQFYEFTIAKNIAKKNMPLDVVNEYKYLRAKSINK